MPAAGDAAGVTEAAGSGTAPRCAEDLRFEKCLGRGFFGEVWRARTRGATDREETFAVKKVKLSLVVENRLSEQLQREIQILYSLRHQRVIRLHFDFSDGKAMYLGMEFASGGSLFEKLSAAGKFASEEACRYFFETCEALDYLHHLPEKVIHRDIKPENILLDGEGHVKLADFGWANLIQADKRDTFCGTLDYLPPEMIMGTGHDESVDMWNMGVLLYELTTGKSPFGSSSKEKTCRMILNVDLDLQAAGLEADARDLVAGLCRKRPKERLAVRGALAHRFVRRFFGGRAPEGGAGGSARQAPTGEEMRQLRRATQRTEDTLAQAERELGLAAAALGEEARRRADVEAQCAKLERGARDREQGLEDLRRRAEGARAEVARLGRGGPAWWPIRRSVREQ